MDYYSRYNLNDIRKRQENEVINEDRKISRMVLDNEFAFLRRLKEVEQIPKVSDKRVDFRIEKYVLDMKKELEGGLIELQQSEGDNAGFSVGKFDTYWNEFVIYLKNFRNLNTLSQSDINKIWTLLDDNILPLMEQIDQEVSAFQASGFQVVFDSYSSFDEIRNYITNRNLKQTTGNIKSETFLANEDAPPPPPEEEPDLVAEPVGFGKKRSKKVNKKKMDTDEFNLSMTIKDINDFKKNEQELKHPKKTKAKSFLPYNDSRDSNYID